MQNRVTQKRKKSVKNLKHYNRREDAVCVPWERCEHAAATACALWKRHGRCKDAVGTSCGRCKDAVGTLWGCCVHALTDKFDIFRCISRPSHNAYMVLECCTNAVASPFGVTGALFVYIYFYLGIWGLYITIRKQWLSGQVNQYIAIVVCIMSDSFSFCYCCNYGSLLYICPSCS